jgi:hypothetical protein
MTLKPGTDGGLPVGAFMGEGRWQSQPTPSPNTRPLGFLAASNCHYPEPMTQAGL